MNRYFRVMSTSENKMVLDVDCIFCYLSLMTVRRCTIHAGEGTVDLSQEPAF